MTINERFAKYTTEQLREALVNLKENIDKAMETIKFFEAENNIEFVKMARKQYDENVTVYFDVKCAYDARMEK